MSERTGGLIVALDGIHRVDDVEKVMDAIRMIKGVSGVTPMVASPETYIATQIAKADIAKRLWDVLNEKEKI